MPISTAVTAEQQQESVGKIVAEPRESEVGVHLEPCESETKAVEQQGEARAEPVQQRGGDRDEAAPEPRQRREKPAQAAGSAADQQQGGRAETSAAVVAKFVAEARRTTLNSDLDPAGKPARSGFRRGERWKARLPTVVARKHTNRQRRGKPVADAAE